MLVLDSAIGCIEADESEVLVLYRSAPIVTTPASGSRQTSMEAYICATQRKSQTKVHLALVADNRRIYVYAEALKAADATGMERSVQQAISCARSMGFNPELVDLAYRPAMREVVLRNIKVLRLPGSKWIASLRAGLPGAPLLPLQPVAGASHKSTVPAPEKSQQPTPAPAISAPPRAAAVMPAGAAPISAADSPGLSRGERSSVSTLQLQKELQLMAAERDALLAQLQQLSVAHQEVVMELSVQHDEATKVTADMERLARAEEQLKEAVAERVSLCSKVQDLTEKLQESQRVAERVEEERSGFAEQLAAAREGNKELGRQLAAAKAESKDLSEKLAAAQDEVKALLAERKNLLKGGEAAAAQHEKVVEENRLLHGELDELRTEREAELGRMSSLEQDLYTLAAELGTAAAEAGAVRAELAAAVTKVAAAEAELVVTRSKMVAAESKGAAIWRKLKATELELESSRTELAAAVSRLPSLVVPAGHAQEPTAESAAPLANVVRGKNAKGESRETGLELLAVAPSQKTEAAPIEFEEPGPGIPEQTAVTKQPPVQQKTPVQGNTPAPGKTRTADKPSVLDEKPVLTPSKPARSSADEPRTAPTDHQQTVLMPPPLTPPRPSGERAGVRGEWRTEGDGRPGNEPSPRGSSDDGERPPSACYQQQRSPVGGAEDNAAEEPEILHELQAVEQTLDEASSWYGVDAITLEPAFSDPPGAAPQLNAASAPPKPHEFPPFGELQENFFSSGEDTPPVAQFVLRPDLKAIEYLNREDVVELHQSINNANMSPDGKGQESCRGYICALRCGDKFQVFTAIYGTRSGRTSVYALERQPEDQAACAGAIRSAIQFAEEVGLMMEAVKGGAAALQDECLVQCPVLKKAA